jgi:hypothetical protein
MKIEHVLSLIGGVGLIMAGIITLIYIRDDITSFVLNLMGFLLILFTIQEHKQEKNQTKKDTKEDKK